MAVAPDTAAVHDFHCTIHTAVNYACAQECRTFKFKATDTATYEFDTILYVLDACASRLRNHIDAIGNFINQKNAGIGWESVFGWAI